MTDLTYFPISNIFYGAHLWSWHCCMWCFVNKKVTSLNSLAPGRVKINFKKVTFQLILLIDSWSISCKIVLKLMPMDLTDGKSTLVQVMTWCRRATSQYLSQCWPKSLLPYGVTRPQWVNLINPSVTVELIMPVTAKESFLHPPPPSGMFALSLQV